MAWILFALLGPAFWTISNFIDKYAIEKITVGIADYAFFGSIGPIIVLSFLSLFFETATPPLLLLSVILGAGFLLNYTYMLYGVILSHADTSRVVPIFQFRTILILVFGAVFFGESLTFSQFVGFLIALIGVLLLSVDWRTVSTPKLNNWSLLALLATFSFGIIVLLNDYAVENVDIPSIIFYFDTGFLIASVSYLLHPQWRRQIVLGLRTATPKKFLLFTINDLADEAGAICSKMALAGAPAAATVTVVNGIQSFYVLIVGIILTTWFPSVIKEDISWQSIVQKLFGAALIFCGIVVLVLF